MDAMVYWGLDVITEGMAFAGGYLRFIARLVVFFPVAAILFSMDFMELLVFYLFTRLLPPMVLLFVVMIIMSLFE